MFDHTDAAAVYTKSQMLNGTTNSQIGVAKSIAVGPGDVIKADVFVKYFGPASGSSNLGSFATALLSAFNLPAPGVGEVGTPSATMQAFGSIIAAGSHPTKNDAHPKGWLNILVFDKNHNLVDMAFQQVDAAYSQPGGTTTKAPHQLLSKQITVKEPGYVYIYISNEGALVQEIYFDDFKITHTKSPIIQTEDYYPFGLTFNEWRRENSAQNRYLYNQGTGEKTFNTERVFDLDLNIDLTKYRAYDPATGKWWQVDPLADEPDLTSLTPYNYSFNNPVRYNDPYGDCPCFIVPFLIAAAEAIVVVAEGATLAAGTTAVVIGVTEIVTNGSIPAGVNPAGAYSPGVGMAMSTSKPGELTSGKLFNSESKAKQVTMPNGSQLPDPGKGKGSVPPEKRDPKRVATEKEKQEMLDKRGEKCEGCDNPATTKTVRAHHKKRHADGGETKDSNLVNLCDDCHSHVHGTQKRQQQQQNRTRQYGPQFDE
jgi:RHS repeat-associated protein